jgi:hypothetical protein
MTALIIKKGLTRKHQSLANNLLKRIIQTIHGMKIQFIVVVFLMLFSTFACNISDKAPKAEAPVNHSFEMPDAYLFEREDIPSFWLTTVDEVTSFLDENVKKGQIEVIGTSAGGRPVRAVVYGNPRKGTGTTTFSGSLGFRDVRAYRSPDHEKTVYMGMAAVHGGEFECYLIHNLYATRKL